jgi:hypothetical protein
VTDVPAPPQITPEVPEWTERLLERLNEPITEETWPEIVLRRPQGPKAVPATDTLKGGFAGVVDFEHCTSIRDAFRDHVEAWTHLQSSKQVEARHLRKDAAERAQLRLGEPYFTGEPCRLEPSWSTANESYEEQNYALLLLSLMFDHITPSQLHRCVGCGDFFLEREPRQKKFCSPACRNRTYVKRYRGAKPDDARAGRRGRRSSQ